jgi:hypothetical protein
MMDDMLMNPKRRPAQPPMEINKDLILTMTESLLTCPKTGTLQDAFDHYVGECLRYSARPPPVIATVDLAPPLLPAKAVTVHFKKNVNIKHAKKDTP